jgi:NAD(P)-dependent dehydrogenase (short-subunit alcohol dehydrogenase family)
VRAALITGATKGIGRAAALALGEGGWWVLATGRDHAQGRALAERLESLSGGGFVAADLTDDGSPETLVAHAVEAAGRLDCLVNNAGIHFLATVENTATPDFDRLMATNLRSAVLMARAAIAPMRAGGGGVIINVSSEAGLVAVPGQVAYNISKAGMVMLTKSIAVDHARDGIRALTVCPGTTRTPLVETAIASADDPAAQERWLAASRPAQRLGTPEEIAAVIAFAAGNDAPYMTGSEIVVDGGYTAV